GALLRFAEPVVMNDVRVAWVVGTLEPAAIDSELKALSRNRFDGRADAVLLLDRNARVLAGGSTTLPNGASMVGKDIFAGRTLTPEMFDKSFVLATEYVGEGGEELVGFAQVLSPRPWAVVVRRPASVVYGALHEARRLLAFTAAAFALFAMAIGAWIAARTTRPVRALVDLSNAYARREFDTRSTVRTGDELEGLGDAMGEMAAGIASGEAEIARRAAIQVGLSRYLPQEIAKAIAEGKRTLALGGERRSISVLFADVVSFTPFAEQASPELVVTFLNELFTILTEVVFRHEGTVDKFMGDCVMAVFGAPSDQPDHAARAIAAAEDMHRFVEANAPAWKRTFGVEVRLGIGISSGDALVGNLGSEARMEYTAIGDVVNVASRLEGLAQAGQTLVTSDVATAVGEAFTFTALGEHPLRGKKQLVQIFEVT
ncbi:MAG: adenylate/guanylate cyclase domain-containing protein, partial [Polyangiaceae bacterium]